MVQESFWRFLCQYQSQLIQWFKKKPAGQSLLFHRYIGACGRLRYGKKCVTPSNLDPASIYESSFSSSIIHPSIHLFFCGTTNSGKQLTQPSPNWVRQTWHPVLEALGPVDPGPSLLCDSITVTLSRGTWGENPRLQTPKKQPSNLQSGPNINQKKKQSKSQTSRIWKKDTLEKFQNNMTGVSWENVARTV